MEVNHTTEKTLQREPLRLGGPLLWPKQSNVPQRGQGSYSVQLKFLRRQPINPITPSQGFSKSKPITVHQMAQVGTLTPMITHKRSGGPNQSSSLIN